MMPFIKVFAFTVAIASVGCLFWFLMGGASMAFTFLAALSAVVMGNLIEAFIDNKISED